MFYYIANILICLDPDQNQQNIESGVVSERIVEKVNFGEKKQQNA